MQDRGTSPRRTMLRPTLPQTRPVHRASAIHFASVPSCAQYRAVSNEFGEDPASPLSARSSRRLRLVSAGVHVDGAAESVGIELDLYTAWCAAFCLPRCTRLLRMAVSLSQRCSSGSQEERTQSARSKISFARPKSSCIHDSHPSDGAFAMDVCVGWLALSWNS